MSFTWESAIAELEERRRAARLLGGERRVARQHDQGRLTVRERIERTTSEFYEIGQFARYTERGATGEEIGSLSASYVCGLGKIAGRPVAIGGEDFTVAGGAPQMYLDRMKGGLGGFVEDLAHNYKIPLVMFLEGIGGDVGMQDVKGHSYLVSSISWQRSYELLTEVPVISAVLGAAAGGAAGRAVLSHFSVMTKGSVLFAGGPPIVRRALGRDIDKTELGGADMHTKVSGAIDNLAEDEDDAIRQVCQVLSYLPQNVWELPTRGERTDPVERRADELLEIIPENRRHPYEPRSVVRLIVDQESFFEVGARWGRSLVTGFARMDGIPIGVVASNPWHLAGSLDAAGAEKQIRFVDTCSTFHLPILYLADVPGFMVGPDAERGNVVRWGMRAIQSMIQAEVPVITIQVRKCYGMAASATANPDALGLRLAWPSGEWGDMPVEGGVEAAFRREIDAAEDPEAFRHAAEQRLLELGSPWKTAEAFGIEEIIDPRETREIVAAFLNASLGALESNVGPQRRRWSIRP